MNPESHHPVNTPSLHPHPKPTFAERGPHPHPRKLHPRNPRELHPRHPRTAGSLLILIVTVLVIIALVGIAFLQRVRLDQAATARHERDYIDQVISGILTEISNQLTDDVFDNLGGEELYDYPWTKQVAGLQDTYYLDNLPSYSAGQNVNVNGADTAGVMNHEDDRWLASTAPIYNKNTNHYYWLHLTNLTNFWLDLPEQNNATGKNIPFERPINGPVGNVANSDTNILLDDKQGNTPNSLAYSPANYQQLGVDTDLDGILDARWQWAPISVRELGGRQYVMAVRIVDLSAMINVNAALNGTGNGFEPFSNPPAKSNVMRGYDTTGIDLSRLTKRVNYNDNTLINYTPPGLSTFSGHASEEMQDLFEHRSLQTSSAPIIPSNPSLPISAKDARKLWEKQASIYGNLDRNYLTASEFDLRKQGGINDFDKESPLEEDMPRLLRQAPIFDSARWGIERSYEDVVGSTGSFESKISKWFYGTNPSSANDKNTDSSRVADRTFRGIRHMLTTASGSAVYNTKYGGAGTGIGTLKFSLNRDFNGELTDGDPTTEDKMRNRIEAALTLPEPGTPSANWYLGISNQAEMDLLIDEYVAAIINYSDDDNIPQQYNGVYGLEKLPFLRQVYVQALYTDQDLDDGTGNPGNDGLYDTWGYDPATGDTRAMAIEIGNPFSEVIYGQDTNPVDGVVQLDGVVQVRVVQGGNITTFTFGDAAAVTAPTPDLEPRNVSSDDDTIIIYSPPIDAIDENGNPGGPGTDMPNELNFPAGASVLELSPGTLTQNFDPGNGDLRVELWVNTPDGFVRYDKIDLDSDASLPTQAASTHTASATQSNQFAQASSARDCEDIHFVVDDGPGTADINTQVPNASTPVTFSANIDRFGDDNKGNPVTPYGGIYADFFDTLQLPMADRPLRSLAELAWVHMFGFTAGETFSERMSASLSQPGFEANRHFLLINPKDPAYQIIGSPSDKGVPHAAVLMDLFSTVSPENDGRDNDNADGDDAINTGADETAAGEIEQFVPGTINVNTATLPVLTLGSPLAEPTDDIEAMMRLILAYRDRLILNQASYPDDPATPYPDGNIRNIINGFNGINRPNKPGIASIGELLFMNLNGTNAVYNMQRYGQDGLPALPYSGALLDLYPDPDEIGATHINQGDDNEQRLARFQMLSQALSTRSDTFVAYVVVRGYEQAGFDKLPVESAQFIAIFNRGDLDTENKEGSPDIQFLRLQ